jgi:hypothetical protein
MSIPKDLGRVYAVVVAVLLAIAAIMLLVVAGSVVRG